MTDLRMTSRPFTQTVTVDDSDLISSSNSAASRKSAFVS